jgi:hypothetical protein
VLRRTTSWLAALIVLGSVPMSSIRTAWMGNVVNAIPVSCGPQFMLYVTVPLMFRNSSSPQYGLRIGEFRKRPDTTQLVAKAPIQRELIDIQLRGNSDVRIALGRRLIWNVTRESFGSRSDPVVLAVGVPIKGIRPSEAVNQEFWGSGDSGMSALASDPLQWRQVYGEKPATVEMVIPLHWTAADRRAAHMRLRPAIKFANARIPDAVLPPRSLDH